jgi:hypothetical protein
MKKLGYLALVAAVLTIVATQSPTRALAAGHLAGVAPDSDIDPDAVAALNSMGSYLRSIKAFQVMAVTTKDDVLDNGQQIQYDTHIDLLARMPDRLRLEVTSARQHRLYLYDGKNFTVWAQRVNYYATVPAPATVGKLADVADEKYGIQLPLEDLFFWGTSQAKGGDIKGAIDVGPAEVGGVTCEQYAFRQDGLDWQIWIQKGDYPLPRKLALTTLTDEARPQYSAVLTWNLAPSFDEAAFEFDPPKDAEKIVLADVDAPTSAPELKTSVKETP